MATFLPRLSARQSYPLLFSNREIRSANPKRRRRGARAGIQIKLRWLWRRGVAVKLRRLLVLSLVVDQSQCVDRLPLVVYGAQCSFFQPDNNPRWPNISSISSLCLTSFNLFLLVCHIFLKFLITSFFYKCAVFNRGKNVINATDTILFLLLGQTCH